MDNKEVVLTLVDKANRTSGLSWDDVKVETGLPYSKDHIRKMAAGAKLAYDCYIKEMFENITDDEKEELHELLTKVKKERVKNQDLKTYINRTCREDARHERILEYAQDIANKLNVQFPLITTKNIKDNNENNEGILTLSDLHIGLETNNHWNKFNKDVLLKRLEYLKNNTVTYGKQNKITKLNMVFIGDLVNGLLHTTTRIENQEDVAEQTVNAAEILSEFIHSLSEHFNITVYYSVGNHGRITANKSDSIDGENFEYFIKYIMKMRCKDIQNVEFKDNYYDKELIYFNCLGWKIAATHGDKFGNKKNMVQHITTMINEVPDYVCMGHLHHNFLDTVGKCELIINGSLSGTDTYAKNFSMISRPSQNLLIINKKIGKQCLYNIYLDRI